MMSSGHGTNGSTGLSLDATVMRGSAPQPAPAAKPITGAGIALDVLLIAIAVGVTWWLSENVWLTVIIGLEIVILAGFVWRITGTTPGSLTARLAFGIGTAPSVSEDETRVASLRVTDRGFADAVVADDFWIQEAAQAAAGGPHAPIQHGGQPHHDFHSAMPQHPQQPHPHPAVASPMLEQPHGFPNDAPPFPVHPDLHDGQHAGMAHPSPQGQGAPAMGHEFDHHANAAQPHWQRSDMQQARPDAPAPLPSPVSGAEPQRRDVIAFESRVSQPDSAAEDRAHQAAPERAPVVVLPNGERVPVVETLLIGRKPRPDGGETPITLDDESRSISRSHLRIRPETNGPVIEDAGSANGTRVRRGGQEFAVPEAPAVPLQLGDVIILGRFQLEMQ